MRIIHTADLHLDSKLKTHLDTNEAKIRRAELLNNFERLVNYAEDNGVRAILISGDLFDVRRVSANAKNTVEGVIRNHPNVVFFYLKGNHDNDDVLSQNDEAFENLVTFGKNWKSYQMKEEPIVITGLELDAEGADELEALLPLSQDKFNIVMLHGMISEYQNKKNGSIINLSALRNKNIDYLALGHIHQHYEDGLSPKGVMAYPGCLEGRGMDEAGEHGFILLDIDTTDNNFEMEFVPFALREVIEVRVDVKGLNNTVEILQDVNEACSFAGATDKDYVHVILIGDMDAEAEKNIIQIEDALSQKYYVSKVTDKTNVHVDYSSYINDASLKGEFVRLVQSKTDLSDEEKSEIIRAGILSLRKEEF